MTYSFSLQRGECLSLLYREETHPCRRGESLSLFYGDDIDSFSLVVVAMDPDDGDEMTLADLSGRGLGGKPRHLEERPLSEVVLGYINAEEDPEQHGYVISYQRRECLSSI